jgi:phenol/toluene 2-monooxygenase (NADH) P0/A0
MQAMPAQTSHELDAAALARKYVRVIERRPDGFVAFEFSIGWPELAVELLLPASAFDEFCAAQRVQRVEG